MSRRLVALACLVVFASTGCTREEPEPAAVGGRRYVDPSLNDKPCELLKAAEVSEAVGRSFKAGRPFAGSAPIGVVGMQYCRFFTGARGGDAPALIFVGVTSAFAEKSFQKYKEKNAPQPVSPPSQEVLGPDAVYRQAAASHTVVVLRGRRVLGVQVTFVQKDPQRLAETLAARAAARL